MKISILSIAVYIAAFGPVSALDDQISYQTFHEGTENYYRYPPGSTYQREYYRFSVHLPPDVEACSDDGFPSHHGPVLGPADVPCLVLFRRPAVSLHAFWLDPPEDYGGVPGLVRMTCGTNRPTDTAIVVDGQRFRRCVHADPGLGSLVKYFTYRAPEVFTVTIVCPTTGSCRETEKKWAKTVFDSLKLDWSPAP